MMFHLQTTLNLFRKVVERLYQLEMFLFVPIRAKVRNVSEAYCAKLLHHLLDDYLFRLGKVNGSKGYQIG